MSYIPNLSTGQSIFALETTFQSTPGTQDPTYNPRILDGVELHQFFTTQAHYIGKYIEGIIVNTNGITFPQGWYFVLDPYLYYSSGTTYNGSPYLTWNINGSDVLPRFQSHYINGNEGAGASNGSYRGLRFLDCSTSSQTVKLIARGAGWASMGNVYFDNKQTSSASTANHRSNITIYAIDATTYQNPTVRTLDASEKASSITLNKFWVNTTSTTTSATYNAPTPTQAGDWFGLMQLNPSTGAITITSPSTSQTLVSSVRGQSTTTLSSDQGMRTSFKWVWSGIRWVEVPISQNEFVKI